ncbi:MAG: hypothetical protein LBU48_06980, partial [Coriobacteriales bacterium]|nr:hypothetical protein [Coriobacteriales bacterium]
MSITHGSSGFGGGFEEIRCSFCGKTQDMVRKLIAGPNVFICDECVQLCEEIVEHDLAEAELETDDSSDAPLLEDLPTPV